MPYKLSAEVNRYRKRIGIYSTLEEAESVEKKLLAKNKYCKPKINYVPEVA